MADSVLSPPAWASWTRTSNDVTGQFLAAAGQPGFISLAGGLPAAELYPVDAVARSDRPSPGSLGRGGPGVRTHRRVSRAARGHRGAHLGRDRRHVPSRSNVLLTTGAMQGLDLLGKVLVDPGDLIVAQFPTYLGALDAWRPRMPDYERLSWDPDQPNPEASLRAAKFVYAVPNFSNPTGVLVPQDQRAALLERVTRAGTWLVEDDPYLALQLDEPVGPGLLAPGCRSPRTARTLRRPRGVPGHAVQEHRARPAGGLGGRASRR